ncbi:stealth conserved region 3 domain-containing protein [Glutamicibacter uratoxydans]|uniref:stealth conserved region 3 domain-containing protein n=1 Tax=Glutamicibacter uratoxydans TaxID=43667 RepID=UPI003D6E8212
MKISFLLTTGDTNAGTEHAVKAQIQGLLQRGHQASIISLYRTDGSLQSAVPSEVAVTYWIDSDGTDLSGTVPAELTSTIFSEPSSLVPYAWDDQFNKLADIVAQQQLPRIDADVLVTTTPALAMLASHFAPDATVIVAQEHRASMRRGVGITPLANVAHNIDAIVSLNNENEDWILEEFAGKGFVSAVIPNSLEDVFRPRASVDNRTIMASGRLAPGKQFDHLLKAFALFRENHPDWDLKLYGSGARETALRTLMGELNLNDSVTIITGLNDLRTEWSKAGIHAMTSRSEGQPLVILEALAAGVPTVAYDCPIGPRNILSHGQDGYLVPLNDTEQFAQTLGQLAEDHELRAAMGRKALETAVAYAPDTINDKWVELYEQLLERRHVGESRISTNLRHASATDQSGSAKGANVDSVHGQASASGDKFQITIVEPEELSVSRVMDDNREAVRSLLAEAKVPFVQIPAYGTYRQSFAVREGDKDALLATIATNAPASLCLRPMRGNRQFTAKDWHPRFAPLDPYAEDSLDTLRAFIPISDSLRRFTWGSAMGVDIEFWTETDEGYTPGRHNPGVDLLTEEDFTNGQILTDVPLWDHIQYPIDVVYTWVDDQDPQWQQQKHEFTADTSGQHELSVGQMRFRNRDELKYSVRSVRSFMPWVRNIYLVTADQYPKWLAEESEIKVITHREIFPEPEVLPVFNSHAIESCLHRIPGLAEHFLYFNDDTMLLRLQDPANYFHGNGLAKFFMSPVKIAIHSKDAEPHMWAAQNNRKMLFQRFGRVITRGMLHTPQPHRKSVLEQIEADYPEVFQKVRAARFRSPSDISLLSSFAQYYGYFTGTYMPGNLKYTYCSLSTPSLPQRLHDLQVTQSFDVLTIGEGENPQWSGEQVDEMIDQFFRSRFPYPAKDEIHSKNVPVPNGEGV